MLNQPFSFFRARYYLFIFALAAFFPAALPAQQYLSVDCTGASPWAYPSINAALPNATPGAFIFVTGPCTENVSLKDVNQLNLGSYSGQPATLNGSISIFNSENVSLYGLNVTNASGDGVSVYNSRGISLNISSSSGNAGVGLVVGGMSDVSIYAYGAFDHNGRGGINIGGDSMVTAIAWAGPLDISSNGGPGIFASQGNFSTLGSTTIVNNVSGAGSNSGFGIDLRGGAHAQIGALFGPNTISGNQSGGASLQETAEISFWSIDQPNVIQNNGPVGVSAGFGSQVTFANSSGSLGAQISGHSSAGVDLYANSQAYFLGINQVAGNGTLADPRSAGIRVDGNSEAFFRGGQVAHNNGPGILALVNSSVDFAGVTFTGNAGGEIIDCDSSSWMISDLALPNRVPPAGVVCRTPHGLGNRTISKTEPLIPDWTAQKVRLNKYLAVAIKH